MTIFNKEPAIAEMSQQKRKENKFLPYVYICLEDAIKI